MVTIASIGLISHKVSGELAGNTDAGKAKERGELVRPVTKESTAGSIDAAVTKGLNEIGKGAGGLGSQGAEQVAETIHARRKASEEDERHGGEPRQRGLVAGADVEAAEVRRAN
ncbi:hypothetical protein [Actinomycetospora atypica]|uniref:Uncharacterized protein n=1 Tax=Actinomycetospora atypica TaxID=1290095 RepID=A0ABV9YI92_9PSEU